jgi:translation initiation factor 2B subunit (eIF-2B alpha/beta/delta family)
MLRLVLSGLIALKSPVVNLGHLEALNLIELNVYRKREREQNVSTTEENLVKHLDEVNKVVEEYLKGNDPTKISKELALPRTKVVALIEEWRQMAADNAAIRARAKEALVGADTHYNKLIAKAYEVIDDATTTANLGAKNGAIKLVMDIEKTRIDMLQKAGLLENQELAEEMIEIEEKQQILVSILRDVASEHPEIRDKIMSRLSQFARKGEVITVVHNNV